jgi:site-specific DNA recombinase
MKVALYARVSTVKQAEKDLSIPDQLRQMREWCERTGNIVVAEYIEEGASATDDRRPAFQKMKKDACSKDRAFECIVVHSLSRFFRDLYEFIFHERELNRAGVKVFSITQQTGDDPAGEMARKIFNLFDEYQSKETSKHTLRAMEENARRGFFNGSRPKFGFRVEHMIDGRGNSKGKLVVDPAEASIVRKMFDFYLSHLGAKQVAETLNRSGETCRGRPWTKNRILNILSDPAYCGNLYFNRYDHKAEKLKPEEQWIKIEVPPMILKDVWDKAQKMRKERERQTTNPAITGSKTLLTGLAFCGLCGSGMQMETAKGGSYIYYNCRSYVRSGKSTCHGQRIPAQDLESAVLSHMSNYLFTEERIRRILAGVLSNSKTLIRGNKNLRNKLVQERRDAESRLRCQYDAIERGIVSTSDVSERIKELKAKRDQIDDQLQKVQVSFIPPNIFTERSIEDFQRTVKDLFMNPDRDFTKRYLKLFIDRITINGRQVRIEGKPGSILATMQNKTAVKTGVLTAVNNWLPEEDSNL